MAGKWNFMALAVLSALLVGGCKDKESPEAPAPAAKAEAASAPAAKAAPVPQKAEAASKPSAAAVNVVPQGEVKPEVWTLDFTTALAKAKAEHRPMIITGGNTTCGGCKRMVQHFDDKLFQHWVKGTGIYLVRIYMNTASQSATQTEGLKFLKALPADREISIPHVGVYWPRENGEPVTAHFEFYQGKMPGRHPLTLFGEAVTALDNVLADYFKGQKRLTWEELVKATKKKISVAREGHGAVVILPENGELECGGKVRLVSQPANGYKFKGWKGPGGSMLKEGKTVKSINLTYTAKEGTYTAVFGK